MPTHQGHSTYGTINAADETIVLSTGDRGSASVVVDTGGAAATLTYAFEISFDGGTNYETWLAFGVDATPAPVSTVAVAAATVTSTAYYVPLPGGATTIRVRLSAYTSGDLNVRLRAVDTPPGHVLATLVDSSGVVGGAASVSIGTGATDIGKLEDSVHASGDGGVPAWAVRSDTPTAKAADGDYTPILTDGTGRLQVSLTGVAAGDLAKAEDAVHASGDVGVMDLAVRQDAPTSMAAAGDYHPKSVDAAGALWSRGRNPNTLANGQVATSTTSAELVATRAQRSNCTVKNLDASITVWIGTGTVTTANGMELKAGESITLVTTAAINGRSASGTPTIAYVEEYFS